jgi:hypothetical protein
MAIIFFGRSGSAAAPAERFLSPPIRALFSCDLVCVRSNLYPAPEEFFESEEPPMDKANADRLQGGSGDVSTLLRHEPHIRERSSATETGFAADLQVSLGTGSIRMRFK